MGHRMDAPEMSLPRRRFVDASVPERSARTTSLQRRACRGRECPVDRGRCAPGRQLEPKCDAVTCSSENFLLGATRETCAGLSVMSPGGRTYFSSLGVKAPRERTSNLCVPCLRALFLPCAVSVLNWQRPGVLLSCICVFHIPQSEDFYTFYSCGIDMGFVYVSRRIMLRNL